MPYLNIVTNQPITDETALLKVASKTVAQASGNVNHWVKSIIQFPFKACGKPATVRMTLSISTASC